MKQCAVSPHHGHYDTVCKWCEPELECIAALDPSAIESAYAAWEAELLHGLACAAGLPVSFFGGVLAYGYDANGSEAVDEPFMGDE